MKCKDKKCDGLLYLTNTFYDENNTAFRRRKCNKCGITIFTAEKEIKHNEFNVAMGLYYKRRRMKRED